MASVQILSKKQALEQPAGSGRGQSKTALSGAKQVGVFDAADLPDDVWSEVKAAAAS